MPFNKISNELNLLFVYKSQIQSDGMPLNKITKLHKNHIYKKIWH